MQQVTLKVVGGDMGAAEIPLHLPAVIGRGRDVAINVSHPLVSRRHCELTEVQGQIWVRDLGSLNGTFVGSERIDQARLLPGQLLTVGTVTFRAVYEAGGLVTSVGDGPTAEVPTVGHGDVGATDDTQRAAAAESLPLPRTTGHASAPTNAAAPQETSQ